MSVKSEGTVARAELEALLKVEDLEVLLRVDRRTVSRLCKQGHLPKPFKLGGSNRWRTKDVAEVLEKLATQRNEAVGEGM